MPNDLTNMLYGGPGDGSSPVSAPPTSPASTSTAVSAAVVPGGIGSDANFPVAPGRPPMNFTDRDALIKTVAGEAGGEPILGQAALAHVILNRLNDGGYGSSVKDIVNAPAPGVDPRLGYHEFTMWNPPNKHGNLIGQNLSPNDPNYQKIGAIVDRVYNGYIPDPTGGATHYYAPQGMPGGRPPAQWPQGWFSAAPKTTIGRQVFIGGAEGPGRILPPSSQVTGGVYDAGIGAT
jgi:spore germination cell wall hydrolase CwlJ-like protein